MSQEAYGGMFINAMPIEPAAAERLLAFGQKGQLMLRVALCVQAQFGGEQLGQLRLWPNSAISRARCRRPRQVEAQ